MTKGFLERVETRPSISLSSSRTTCTQAYADAALRNRVRDIASAQENTRNDTLHRAAYQLRPYINGGALDEQFVVDELTTAASMAGLDDFEIPGTIRSGFNGSDAKNRPSITLEPTKPPALVSSIQTDSGNGIPDNPWGDFTPLDGAEWMFDGDDGPTAIWGLGNEILWADGEALMIAGVLGLGKTTLAGRLVRGLLGFEDTVLGLPIQEVDRPILYLAMDRPRQIRRSMRRQFSPDDRDRIAGRLIVRPGPPLNDLALDPLLLTRMAQKVDAGTVFLDSLKDAVIGLVSDETAASYNRARQHLLARGVNLCELHHMVKRNAQGGPPTGIEDVYGSGWLTAGAGSVITLSGKPGDLEIKFRLAKLAAEQVGPWKLDYEPDAGTLEVRSLDLAVVVANQGADGATAKDVAKLMFDTRNPSDAEAKRAARQLDKLVKAGVLTRIDGHRGGDGGSVPTCWFVATKPEENAETGPFGQASLIEGTGQIF